MNPIRARLEAVLASLILATLGSWGVREITPEMHVGVEAWINYTFDVVLFLGYAVIHPWLQKRCNPTGAFTPEAARKLERVAHIREGL